MTRPPSTRGRHLSFTAATPALALGLLFGAGAQPACKRSRAAVKNSPRPVRYARISTGAGDARKSFSASIQAGDTTQLSFRVSGSLARVAFKRGDAVDKGQLIARLDDTDYKVKLSQASAQRQSAMTRRDGAKTQLSRIEKLFEGNSASLSDYENAKTQVRTAEAELRAVGQQVAAARNQLEYTRLTAPFDGVLEAVNGKPGEAVQAGRVIAVLGKGDQLEVSAMVPEAFISQIQVGTPANVEVPALGDTSFQGEVSEVAFASQGASAYPVIVALGQVDASMRPGMAATVTFDLGSGPAKLRVPVAAVGNEESGNFVYLLEPRQGSDTEFTVEKHSVSLGQLDGEYFEIESGLSEGALVATAGLSVLLDGMIVRLLHSADEHAEKDSDRGDH